MPFSPPGLTGKQVGNIFKQIVRCGNGLFFFFPAHVQRRKILQAKDALPPRGVPENKHFFNEHADGTVEHHLMPFRIRKVKPEPDIYEHLLTEHRLSAAETVFIDDMRENLAAASSMGIQTIRFENAVQCRQDLVDLGCL